MTDFFDAWPAVFNQADKSSLAVAFFKGRGQFFFINARQRLGINRSHNTARYWNQRRRKLQSFNACIPLLQLLQNLWNVLVLINLVRLRVFVDPGKMRAGRQFLARAGKSILIVVALLISLALVGIDITALSVFGGDWLKSLNSDAGFGIRLYLPIGPIKLDYAWPLRWGPDGWNDAGGRFNFNIGYAF